MISTHVYLHNHVSNDLGIYHSKKKKKKNLNILNLPICQIIKQDEAKIKQFEDAIIKKKCDQVMAEEV
jgi:hypothetical protein